MSTKHDELTNLLEISYREQKRYIATLTPEERTAAGSVDDWSPKDVMAHVVHWDAQAAADMANVAQDKPPDDSDDPIEELNARIWEKYKDRSWAQIEELVDDAHRDLVANLQRLTEEQLTDSDRYEWMNNRPFWRRINFGCFYHPLQHVAELFALRGDVAYANQIQEDAVQRQLALVGAEDWQGTVLYNLGCHYAITGQREEALANVRRGIALYPYLKEWAPQDSDLASLHDDPEFKALLD